MPQCPIYHTDTRRTIGVLQQWQALLAPTHTRATEVTLADMAALMASWQEAFGATTTLETMIQSLVAADLREQIARRRAITGSPVLVSGDYPAAVRPGQSVAHAHAN